MPDVQQIRLDPDPLEPYALSQGFRVGDLVIVSGQAAIDEQGRIVGAGDFDAQAEQTFRNLARVLEAGGSSLERIVKVTIFLTDMANFPKIVELRRRWFTPPYPADTIVEVVVARAAGARDRDRGARDGRLAEQQRREAPERLAAERIARFERLDRHLARSGVEVLAAALLDRASSPATTSAWARASEPPFARSSSENPSHRRLST